MCTGGGALLTGRWCGSTTLTPPEDMNQIFPFGDLPAFGLMLGAGALLRTPSEVSKTVTGIERFGSLSHAFASEGEMRTKPQAMYNHNEWSSSSITQWTSLQGRPFLLLIVAARPFFNRLSPPPSVAAHSAPSGSTRKSLTTPS